MRIGRVDGGQLGEEGAAARMNLLHQFQDRKLDIGRGERLTVVPGDILAQVENEGLAVVLLFLAGGQARRGLEVGVVFEQRIEDVV